MEARRVASSFLFLGQNVDNNTLSMKKIIIISAPKIRRFFVYNDDFRLG